MPASQGMAGATSSGVGSFHASGGNFELFPLPLLPEPERHSVGLARRTRHRISIRHKAVKLANETITGLNRLSHTDPAAHVEHNSARLKVVDEIFERALNERPPSELVSPQAALEALLGAKASPYLGEGPCSAAPFELSALSLPAKASGCRLEATLGDDDLLDLQRFEERLCLTDGELKARRCKGGMARLHWDQY